MTSVGSRIVEVSNKWTTRMNGAARRLVSTSKRFLATTLSSTSCLCSEISSVIKIYLFYSTYYLLRFTKKYIQASTSYLVCNSLCGCAHSTTDIVVFPLLRITGVSSCLCGRSSDERISFVLVCERFCSFSSLHVARLAMFHHLIIHRTHFIS